MAETPILRQGFSSAFSNLQGKTSKFRQNYANNNHIEEVPNSASSQKQPQRTLFGPKWPYQPQAHSCPLNHIQNGPESSGGWKRTASLFSVFQHSLLLALFSFLKNFYDSHHGTAQDSGNGSERSIVMGPKGPGHGTRLQRGLHQGLAFL